MNIYNFPDGSTALTFTSSNAKEMPSHEIATHVGLQPSEGTLADSPQVSSPVDSTFWWPTSAPTTINWTGEPDNMYRRSAGFRRSDRMVKERSSDSVLTALTTVDGLKKGTADNQWWKSIMSTEDNVKALQHILHNRDTSPGQFQNPSGSWTKNYLHDVFQTAYQAALFDRLCQVVEKQGVDRPCKVGWGGYTESAGVVNVHIVHPTSFLVQKSIMHLTLAKQAWSVKKTLREYLDIYGTELDGLKMTLWLEKVGREWGVCVALEGYDRSVL